MARMHIAPARKSPAEKHAAEEAPSRGSSLDSYSSPLDQARAASMADEGGTAAAVTDAREQASLPRIERDNADPRTKKRKGVLTLIAQLVASCAVVLGLYTLAVVDALRPRRRLVQRAIARARRRVSAARSSSRGSARRAWPREP